MPQNPIQHIEWTTREPGRLRSFFSRVFDWKFSEAMPGYTLIQGVGGIFAAPDPQMPVGITPYVTVADLGETEQKIKVAGGRIHKSQQEVPGRGWFTIFSDPDGTLLALWQAMPKPRATKRSAVRSAKSRGKAKKPKAKRPKARRR